MSDFINQLPKDDRVWPGRQAYQKVDDPFFDDLYAVGYAIKGGKRLRVNKIFLTREQIRALAVGAEVEFYMVVMCQAGYSWETPHKYMLGVFSSKVKAHEAGKAESDSRGGSYRYAVQPAQIDQPLKYWREKE